MRRELWFGFTLMGLILIGISIVLPPPSEWHNGHLGLLMLSLVVVAIMLGFPTAFTLMGMGVFFSWLAYRSANPDIAIQQTLDLMVQRAYAVMTNDVLIAVPLFVFMGYLVERANLIEKLFKSLHLALARLPGSLAVATLVTCTIFATATGIVGAVVTLMGLLAFPAMLRAGYSVPISAGAIAAGGCLGILIPPSVLLIVYGATAGVSVVQLYAGAFFPGLMLAGLYIVFVVLMAMIKPKLAPSLPESERRIDLPAAIARVQENIGKRAVPSLIRALKGKRNSDVPASTLVNHLIVALLPALVFAMAMGLIYRSVTSPVEIYSSEGLTEMTSGFESEEEAAFEGGLQPPPLETEEPPLKQPAPLLEEKTQALPQVAIPEAVPAAAQVSRSAPLWFWIVLAVGIAGLAVFYALFNFARLEIFKMLLGSFFPLAVLILAVLGAIVFGLATPTEAAAVGALGGALLAAAYRRLNRPVITESVFLTAKTTAMVCWLFVGSSIFSAAFALLGGQELVEQWVLSMDLTPIQFLILAQVIIFLLGWPLEWTEIIVIFMPIFIPLLGHFNIDPLFFGLLVAMNLQTAFLSPPVAMAAFYLKGVAPPHVTLNQIFLGMLPYMAIQIVALILLYTFPDIGLWLPRVLYE
ncbi:MAG TPA: TRAP transporter large permease subunit [Burkholderiales bacterium]|nr:TRAP transporter large permease subunit [Burkholderiales bacterium]